MAKKKSAKKAAEKFQKQLNDIDGFLERFKETSPRDNDLSWAYDLAVIRAYRAFENFVLECMICGINNDTKQLSKKKGFDFPKHLTDEVCKYIIVGERFFDFKGRSGLISTAKSYLADEHYFIEVVKKRKFTKPLDKLIALRNFAAHDSAHSKNKALSAVGLKRMSSAGSYLKKRSRWNEISTGLKRFASDIYDAAPY